MDAEATISLIFKASHRGENAGFGLITMLTLAKNYCMVLLNQLWFWPASGIFEKACIFLQTDKNVATNKTVQQQLHDWRHPS